MALTTRLRPHRRDGRPAGRALVVAHRGASGYRPENTLSALSLAALRGADAAVVPLVPTRDGVLVVRSGPELSGSTDVARVPDLAGRYRTWVLDGRPRTGWFSDELDAAELAGVRAREPLRRERPGVTLFDRHFGIPTLDDVLDLQAGLRGRRGAAFTLHLELASAEFFRRRGSPVEDLLAATLGRRRGPSAPLALRCADGRGLDLARAAGLDLPALVHLDRPSTGDVARVGLRGARGVVLDRADAWEHVVPVARAAGLEVHVGVLRAEPCFLPPHLRLLGAQGALADAREVLALGVDAVVTDQPDVVAAARDDRRGSRRAS